MCSTKFHSIMISIVLIDRPYTMLTPVFTVDTLVIFVVVKCRPVLFVVAV